MTSSLAFSCNPQTLNVLRLQVDSFNLRDTLEATSELLEEDLMEDQACSQAFPEPLRSTFSNAFHLPSQEVSRGFT